MMLAPDDHRHGTYHGYVKYKCRCDDCRLANATYMRKLRRRNGLSPSAAPIRRAQTKAATWVKDAFPNVWQSLLADAYRDLGVKRRPPGHPPLPPNRNEVTP